MRLFPSFQPPSMQPIYEGKSKRLFATDNPHELIMEFKDDATAFNGVKKGTIEGKGAINNRDGR